jgi:hypothetical protein
MSMEFCQRPFFCETESRERYYSQNVALHQCQHDNQHDYKTLRVLGEGFDNLRALRVLRIRFIGYSFHVATRGVMMTMNVK